jgi:hypothetical protein
VNGVARYSAARLHLPYYADIPTTAINAIDFKVLRENLAYIVASIQKEQAKGAKLDRLEAALAPFGKGDTRKRLERFVDRFDKEPYETGIPDGIHGQIRGKLEGFRNRASSEYMEAVHARAGNHKPILQIYLLEPPSEADIGAMPLVTLAFYWPAHEPSNFCAVTTGFEPRPPAPSPHKFYKTVVEVLNEWNFPMSTRRLRSTVMERLNCTASFFNSHIANRPEGWEYEAVPEHNAYMPEGWDSSAPIDAKIAVALVEAAINILRMDNKEHLSKDVFRKVLEDPKLGDFFSAGKPNDLAYFNSLFISNEHPVFEKLLPNDILERNGVKVVKRRPIIWQYQG